MAYKRWHKEVLGEFRRYVYPSVNGERDGIRDRAVRSESVDCDREQRTDDERRIWCALCVARDGIRTCADVPGHQVRSETLDSVSIMPAMSPNNLGISRQMAVTVSIVSVVVALITLVFAASLGFVNAETLIAFVGMLGVVIPSLVSALKSSEAADTASKVSNTVQFTASQHATVMQMLQSYLEQQEKKSS